ncbi:hypothetical protein Cadr_000006495 [Camelus dromedarius]|uniref:Uncharacterized protein n=1 Tax=Camelus dromedarius TaxID=9838 RepID=A0A5N4E3M6_CAMDR|nr:hypothetical protein Cadr_000006495 [Camelus dromedarius]
MNRVSTSGTASPSQPRGAFLHRFELGSELQREQLNTSAFPAEPWPPFPSPDALSGRLRGHGAEPPMASRTARGAEIHSRTLLAGLPPTVRYTKRGIWVFQRIPSPVLPDPFAPSHLELPQESKDLPPKQEVMRTLEKWPLGYLPARTWPLSQTAEQNTESHLGRVYTPEGPGLGQPVGSEARISSQHKPRSWSSQKAKGGEPEKSGEPLPGLCPRRDKSFCPVGRLSYLLLGGSRWPLCPTHLRLGPLVAPPAPCSALGLQEPLCRSKPGPGREEPTRPLQGPLLKLPAALEKGSAGCQRKGAGIRAAKPTKQQRLQPTQPLPSYRDPDQVPETHPGNTNRNRNNKTDQAPNPDCVVTVVFKTGGGVKVGADGGGGHTGFCYPSPEDAEGRKEPEEAQSVTQATRTAFLPQTERLCRTHSPIKATYLGLATLCLGHIQTTSTWKATVVLKWKNTAIEVTEATHAARTRVGRAAGWEQPGHPARAALRVPGAAAHLPVSHHRGTSVSRSALR